MPSLRRLSLLCVVSLCHCGGEVAGTQPVGEMSASGGTGAALAGNGEAAGVGGACGGSSGASAGELSTYEKLRSACRLDLKVNRRGEAIAGNFTIK
jgi:hypothetical protein